MKTMLTVVCVVLFACSLQAQVWIQDTWLTGVDYTSGQKRQTDIEYASSMKTVSLDLVGPLGKNFYLEATESLGLQEGFNMSFEGIGVGVVGHILKQDLWHLSLRGSYLMTIDYYQAGETILRQTFGTHLIQQFPLADAGWLRVRYALQSQQQNMLNTLSNDEESSLVWRYAHVVEPVFY